MKRARALLAATALAACAHSDPTRFWTLEPLAGAPEPAVVAPVRVDGVRIPLTLDRQEVVQTVGEGRVAVRDFDRWSAPLGSLMRQTLTQDLLARLPAGSVIFPAAPKPANARGIVVDVLDLTPAGGDLDLDVSWTLVSPGRPTPLQRRELRLHAPLAGPAVADLAAATSRLVAQLSDDIATHVAEGGAGE